MGCDVLPGGIPGLGAASVFRHIQRLEEQTQNDRVDCFLRGLAAEKRCQVSEHELNVLVDSWLFEPGSDISDNQDTGIANSQDTNDEEYVFQPPNSHVFDSYLTEFASPLPTVIRNVASAECHGHYGQSTHLFLASLGVTCQECNVFCCAWCFHAYTPSKHTSRSKWTCLECAALEIPRVETMEEMREAIIERGLRMPVDIRLDELHELYEEVVVRFKGVARLHPIYQVMNVL